MTSALVAHAATPATVGGGVISTSMAALALTIAAILVWKKKTPRIAALLALAAGVGITGGLLGRFLTDAVRWMSSLVGDLTSQMLGSAVPAVLAVAALIVFVHDVWPKHTPSRITPAIGLLLPVLVASIGGAAGTLATSAIHMISSALAGALATIFGRH